MSVALDIAGALDRAGVARLSGPARAYLAGRLTRSGGIDLACCNLGALRDVTFGAAAAVKPGKPSNVNTALAAVRKALGANYVRAWQFGTTSATSQLVVYTRTVPTGAPSRIGTWRITYQLDTSAQPTAQQPAQQPYYQQRPYYQQQQYAQQSPYYNMGPTQQQAYAQQPYYQQQQVNYDQQQQVNYDQQQQPPDQGDDTAEPVGAVAVGACFPDLDEGARALVSTSYRAAPRAWGLVGEAELGALGAYPIARFARANTSQRYRSGRGWSDPPIQLEDDETDFQLSAAAPPIGWVPGFGPSTEAEQTFRALSADWEAFDRLGVGQRILPHLRQDVIEWREGRDKWKAGNLDSSNINGWLLGETARARRIRTELRDAKIVDPALGHDIQAPGVEHSGGGLSLATSIDTWAASVPLLSWMTSPTGSLARAGVSASAAFGAAGLGLFVLWLVFRRGGGGGGGVTVVMPSARA